MARWHTLLIGFILGTAIALGTGGYYHNQVTETMVRQHETVITTTSSTLANMAKRVTTLTQENKQLSQKIKQTIVTNADGSSKTIFESDTNQKSSKVTSQLQETIQQLRYAKTLQKVTYESEIKSLKKFRPSATIQIGATLRGNYYGSVTYNFLGPYVLGGFVRHNRNTLADFGIGFGFQF